jgi:autotransporter-associated beta strand protein
MTARHLAVVALLLAVPHPALAQYAWTGNTSTSWSNAANWSPAGGPPNAAGVAVTFGDFFTGNTNVLIDTNITAGSIAFSSFTNYNIGLGAGGSFTLNNGAANSSITGSANTLNSTVSANLTVGGNGNLDLSWGAQLGFGTGLTLSGAITASGGTVAVTTGRVILTGSNTYSSDTRIGAGAVLRGAQVSACRPTATSSSTAASSNSRRARRSP